jgi:hypothetical protein
MAPQSTGAIQALWSCAELQASQPRWLALLICPQIPDSAHAHMGGAPGPFHPPSTHRVMERSSGLAGKRWTSQQHLLLHEEEAGRSTLLGARDSPRASLGEVTFPSASVRSP